MRSGPFVIRSSGGAGGRLSSSPCAPPAPVPAKPPLLCPSLPHPHLTLGLGGVPGGRTPSRALVCPHRRQRQRHRGVSELGAPLGPGPRTSIRSVTLVGEVGEGWTRLGQCLHSII